MLSQTTIYTSLSCIGLFAAAIKYNECKYTCDEVNRFNARRRAYNATPLGSTGTTPYVTFNQPSCYQAAGTGATTQHLIQPTIPHNMTR